MVDKSKWTLTIKNGDDVFAAIGPAKNEDDDSVLVQLLREYIKHLGGHVEFSGYKVTITKV